MFPLIFLLAAPSIEAARAHWAAIDRGAHCAAVSRSLLLAPKSQQQPFASIAFDRNGARKGQFAVRFKRATRDGSSVILTVGSKSFQLVTGGDVAWSRDAVQEAAIIDAIRVSTMMKVEARDQSGRLMVDRYGLAGAPTTIDAAAACAARLAKR